MDARGGNASEGHLERLTGRSKQIALRHSDAVKANAARSDRRPSDQFVRRKLFDPRRLKVDDEARYAFPSGARLRLGVQDEEIGDGPHL